MIIAKNGKPIASRVVGFSLDLLVPHKAMREGEIITPKCLHHTYIVWYYNYMRLRNSLAG